MRRRIRIVVADHQPSVRAGIRAALATQPDMVIVGEGACGDDVSHLCRQLQPDIVLLDINLPGPAAAEIVACLQTRCPSTRVLALTRHDDPWVGRLVAAGVATREEVPQLDFGAKRHLEDGDRLMVLGDIVCSWLLLRQAEIALEKLGGEVSEKDKAFYEGKVASAQFFAHHTLPRLSAERVIAEAVDLSVMDLDEGSF